MKPKPKNTLIVPLARCEHGTTVLDSNGRFGTLTPVKEGEASNASDLVHVRKKEEGVYELEPLYTAKRDTAGPAKVATKAYRAGYDRIFGKEAN